MAENDVGNSTGQQSHTTAVQFAAFAAGIAAILIAVTTFLSFLASECQDGGYIPPVFVCFSDREPV